MGRIAAKSPPFSSLLQLAASIWSLVSHADPVATMIAQRCTKVVACVGIRPFSVCLLFNIPTPLPFPLQAAQSLTYEAAIAYGGDATARISLTGPSPSAAAAYAYWKGGPSAAVPAPQMPASAALPFAGWVAPAMGPLAAAAALPSGALAAEQAMMQFGNPGIAVGGIADMAAVAGGIAGGSGSGFAPMDLAAAPGEFWLLIWH